jgi:hypothetical protein
MTFIAAGKRTRPLPGKDIRDIARIAYAGNAYEAILPVWTGKTNNSRVVDPVRKPAARHMPRRRFLRLWLPVLFLAVITMMPVHGTAQIIQVDFNNGGPVTGRGYAESHFRMGQDGAGNLVVVWSDDRHAVYEFEGGDEQSSAVYGRVFDPDLIPQGPDFRISALIPDGYTRLPDLLVFEDGRFAVVWQESVEIGISPTGNRETETRVVMTMKDIHGNTVIPETTVNDNEEPVFISSPFVITPLPGDQFIITWSDRRAGDSFRYGQLYERDGSKIGANFRLTPEGFNNNPTSVRVYYVDETRYLLRHGGSVSIRNPDGLWIRYYDADHQPAGEWVQLQQTGALHPFGADSLLVTFWDSDDLSFLNLYYRFLNPDGTVRSAPVLVNDPETDGIKTEAALARNPDDGSFIITWRDGRNSWPYAVSDIYAQRFDAGGQKVGSNFKVNHEPREKIQTRPAILYSGEGTYIVAWWENRRIICSRPGDYIGNAKDYFLVGRHLDFETPLPGRVWGMDNYMENYWAVCENPEIPALFAWKPNYPNPFNASTTLVFDVYTTVSIQLIIELYDPLGRRVRQVYAGESIGYGEQRLSFDAAGLPSGMYYARMTSPDHPGLVQTIKLLLVK